jgi:hypothetical protein
VTIFHFLSENKAMPPKQQNDELADRATGDPQALNSVVGERVLRALGQPANRGKIQVRRLWQGHYRVNILEGDLASMRVTHSYFLVTDDEGNIVASTPEIRRL